MMLEDRPVIRVKEYRNRATGLQNFKNVRRGPQNLWKPEIVEKVLQIRREGRRIVNRIDYNGEDEEDDDENEEPFEDDFQARLAEISESEESDDDVD